MKVFQQAQENLERKKKKKKGPNESWRIGTGSFNYKTRLYILPVQHLLTCTLSGVPLDHYTKTGAKVNTSWYVCIYVCAWNFWIIKKKEEEQLPKPKVLVLFSALCSLQKNLLCSIKAYLGWGGKKVFWFQKRAVTFFTFHNYSCTIHFLYVCLYGNEAKGIHFFKQQDCGNQTVGDT